MVRKDLFFGHSLRKSRFMGGASSGPGGVRQEPLALIWHIHGLLSQKQKQLLITGLRVTRCSFRYSGTSLHAFFKQNCSDLNVCWQYNMNIFLSATWKKHADFCVVSVTRQYCTTKPQRIQKSILANSWFWFGLTMHVLCHLGCWGRGKRRAKI